MTPAPELTEREIASGLALMYGVDAARAAELARKVLAERIKTQLDEQREQGFRALDAAARAGDRHELPITITSPYGVSDPSGFPSMAFWLDGRRGVAPAPTSVLRAHQVLPGGGFRCVLELAPRTKKNGRKGGFAGIRQGPAYRRYRDAIVDAFAELRVRGVIPLAEQPYNIAVRYYVDGHGKLADKCGLDQGLYDALENAGVVTNDWQFRTDDGTRIVLGDPRPRVELEITPLEED